MPTQKRTDQNAAAEGSDNAGAIIRRTFATGRMSILIVRLSVDRPPVRVRSLAEWNHSSVKYGR